MRSLLVAIAVGLAVLSAGCGVGIGSGPGQGKVELTVTSDYGTLPVAGPESVGLRSSDTVMRVLERATEVETSYGGRFVDAIDGIEKSSGTRSSDWFYFVDGVAAEVGAAEFDLRSGDSVWWDYRDWTSAMDVEAVTGSYPAPLARAGAERSAPVGFLCSAPARTCGLARDRLADDGVVVGTPGEEQVEDAPRVQVGPIGNVPGVRLDEDPSETGVFARFTNVPGREKELEVLDEAGNVVRSYGAGTGLVAAVRDPGNPLLWLLTGTDDAGVRAATSALDPEVLESTYAMVVPPDGGPPVPIPVTGDESGGP